MAPKKHPYQWLGPLSYSVILLVVPAFIAFVGYTDRRQEQFISGRYDTLTNIAAQIENRINNAFNVVNNSTPANIDRASGAFLKQTRIKLKQNSLGLQSQSLKKQDGDPSREKIALTTTGRSKWLVATNGLAVTVDVSSLIGSLRTNDSFSDILLVNENDEVVYQQNPRGGIISKISDLEPVYKEPAGDSASELITDNTDKISYRFQQLDYLVFEAPMLINTEPRQSWRALGMVERRVLRAEKSKLPTTELVAFTFLLSLVILSWPFLRAKYFGPFDVVYRHDMWIQVACVCMGVALISTFILHLYDTSRFFAQLDAEAEIISSGLERDITQELDDQLGLLNRAGAEMVSAFNALQNEAERDQRLDLLSKKKYQYPFYKTLYLMDKSGTQRVKWSANDTITNFGNFADREYFQRALPKNAAELYRFERDDGVTEFFLQVIESRTTGEQSVVVSKPACEQNKNDECVVIVASEMHSVLSGLPYGFGFLIVNKQGDVQFQSDTKHHKQLNIFDQINGPRGLKIVLEDGHGRVTVDYRGDEHRFFVRALSVDGPQWRIITFYNKDLYELFFVESSNVILASWVVWFLLVVASSGLFLMVNMMLGRARMVRLLDRAKYRHIWVLVGLLLVALVMGNDDVRMLACLPAIAVCLLLIRKVSRSLQFATVGQIQSKRFYLVLLMLAMIMVETVLPLFIIHKNTNYLTHNFIINTNAEQFHREVAEQAKRNEIWWAVFNPAVGYGDQSGAYWSGYALFPFPKHVGTGVDGGVDEANCSMIKNGTRVRLAICSFMSALPVYSSEAETIRHASHLKLLNDEEVALTLESFYTEEFFSGPYILLALFLAGLLALFIWAWSSKQMGLKVQNLAKGAALTGPQSTPQKYRIVYGMAERSKRLFDELADPDLLLMVDFRKVTVQSTVEDLMSGGDAEYDTIVVDHFDELIKDPDLIRLRVELLEHLLYKTDAMVYIVTSTDVLAYLNQRVVVGQEVDRKVVARLAVALSSFSRHFFAEKPPEQAPDNASQAIRTLFDECFHPNLQDIRDQVKADNDFDKYQEQQVINLVLARATPLYQIMWDTCSHIEKFTLIQLALDRPVNHNNWAVAQNLKQRGYLRRDPAYRIFNESFKWFIQSVAQTEDTVSWRAEMSSSWDRIKIPVLVLVVCSLGFLAVTQPGFLNNLFAWMVAAGAAIPVAAKLLGSWWATRASPDAASK